MGLKYGKSENFQQFTIVEQPTLHLTASSSLIQTHEIHAKRVQFLKQSNHFFFIMLPNITYNYNMKNSNDITTKTSMNIILPYTNLFEFRQIVML